MIFLLEASGNCGGSTRAASTPSQSSPTKRTLGIPSLAVPDGEDISAEAESYEQLGKCLKLGVHEDATSRTKIAELLTNQPPLVNNIRLTLPRGGLSP